MKKAVTIGLFTLLVFHMLAYALAVVGAWWQAEHDLSDRLLVYRSVDSMVEFDVPFSDGLDAKTITHTTSDGFSYRGRYYSVVSIEVRNNLLHIAALESNPASFWQTDLLSFVNSHVSGATDLPKKANQFVKFLLKEYSPNPKAVFQFLAPHWREAVRISDVSAALVSRTLPIHSPPPEAIG